MHYVHAKALGNTRYSIQENYKFGKYFLHELATYNEFASVIYHSFRKLYQVVLLMTHLCKVQKS